MVSYKDEESQALGKSNRRPDTPPPLTDTSDDDEPGSTHGLDHDEQELVSDPSPPFRAECGTFRTEYQALLNSDSSHKRSTLG